VLRPNALIAALAATFLVLTATAATADDWLAVKLRGSVFAYVDGAWERLARGAIVSDERQIRTQRSGHVTFERDRETIDIGPNTQISIVDRKGRRYTTVKQYFGTVEVQANVEDVQHFAVQTPYLAAIVKGTNFIVTSDEDSSTVRVKRGRVLVDDLSSTDQVLLSAGQSAETDAYGLIVTGRPAAEALPTHEVTIPGLFGPGGSSGSANASGGLGGLVSGGVGIGADGVDVSADAGSVSVDANLDTSGGVSAAADLSVGGAASVSVDTGGLLSGGGEPAGVSVQTPVGGVGLTLPLGL
jgi:hypothetical protein